MCKKRRSVDKGRQTFWKCKTAEIEANYIIKTLFDMDPSFVLPFGVSEDQPSSYLFLRGKRRLLQKTMEDEEVNLNGIVWQLDCWSLTRGNEIRLYLAKMLSWG